jgi:hypothetical protein
MFIFFLVFIFFIAVPLIQIRRITLCIGTVQYLRSDIDKKTNCYLLLLWLCVCGLLEMAMGK